MKIQNAKIDTYIKTIAQEKIAGCLLFGPEISVAKARFDIIAKKIVSDLSDPFLVTNISKERLSEDKGLLGDEFYSMSFMGGRKLIMIKDVDASTASALKDLFADDGFPDKSDNFILIQAGDLDKGSALRKIAEANPHFAAIPCYEDNERVIRQFIEATLSKHQIQFNYQITSYLSEKLGKNRQVIRSELDKIISYLGDKKDLSIDIIEQVIGAESEITANEFVLSYCGNQYDIALKQAEKLFNNGFEPIVLVRYVSNYLQKLYHAKCQIEHAGANFDDVIKAQRLFFKVEGEFRKHLSGNSLENLVKKLKNIEELEIKLKSATISSKVMFISFVQNSFKFR